MKKVVLILAAVLFSITTLTASHYMGVDISYTCNPSGTNPCIYRIVHKAYFDCSTYPSGNPVPLISFSGNPSGCMNPMTAGSWTFVSTGEVTPLCSGAQTKCSTSAASISGVREVVFYRDYNFCNSAANCSFTIIWSICCRNSAISSILNPGSQNIYSGNTVINKGTVPCNNAPVFSTKPVPYLCVGQPFNFNQGAMDPDGDSLAYSLVSCRTANGANVTYLGGLNFVQPLASLPLISLNPVTGDIFIQPTAIAVSVLCIEVKEYRGGQKIGSVLRDMQLTVLSCSNNLPQSYGINGTVTNPTNVFRDTFYANMGGCFNLSSFDPDLLQTVSMTWNNGIPGASFVTTGNPANATFCWVPTNAHVGLNLFTVTVTDNYCPLTGSNQYTFEIVVEPYVVLPVSIHDFAARAAGKLVQLFWRTGDGDLSEMHVERSTDGSSFQSIATISYSTNVNSYQFDDRQLTENHYYYRIRTGDQKGYSYSDVREVMIEDMNSLETQLSVYPNPASGCIQIRLTSPGEAGLIVQLFDPSGRMLRTFKTPPFDTTGDQNLEIDLSTLLPGIYTIGVLGQDKGRYKKISVF